MFRTPSRKAVTQPNSPNAFGLEPQTICRLPFRGSLGLAVSLALCLTDQMPKLPPFAQHLDAVTLRNRPAGWGSGSVICAPAANLYKSLIINNLGSMPRRASDEQGRNEKNHCLKE